MATFPETLAAFASVSAGTPSAASGAHEAPSQSHDSVDVVPRRVPTTMARAPSSNAALPSSGAVIPGPPRPAMPGASTFVNVVPSEHHSVPVSGTTSSPLPAYDVKTLQSWPVTKPVRGGTLAGKSV